MIRFAVTWTRTGDKYVADENGVYTYCGRHDDMMKVGGIYVSPFEVESALLKHEAVLEVAVVGHPDHDGLIKPKAFIVLAEESEASDALTEDLIAFVKKDLASFKYPAGSFTQMGCLKPRLEKFSDTSSGKPLDLAIFRSRTRITRDCSMKMRHPRSFTAVMFSPSCLFSYFSCFPEN